MEPEQHEHEDAASRPWGSRSFEREAGRGFAPPRFHDVRWVIGGILLVGGFLGCLRVIASFDHSATVWSLRHTVLPGDRLRTSDLVRTRAHVAGRAPSAYVGAELPGPDQRVVQHNIAAGELLPRSALGPAKDLGMRIVEVPLMGASHAPEPGSYAEMWVAKRSGDEHTPTYEKPARLVDRVLVDRSTQRRTGAPIGQAEPVAVVQLPPSALPAVVEAVNARAGITLVPITSGGRS